MQAVLLDAMGTLLRLEPPAPRLVALVRERYGVQLEPGLAQMAFAAEIAYYRAHHCEGRDVGSLRELRLRCALVLRARLAEGVGGQEGTTPARIMSDLLDQPPETWLELLLGSLRFSAFADAERVLPVLSAHDLRLAVVSDWDVSLTEVLESVGIARWLEAIVSSAAVGRAKPDPAMFRTVLERLGVSADAALHVGDAPELDIPGARAAGVREAILLRRSPAPRRAGSGSPRVLGSLSELPPLLGIAL